MIAMTLAAPGALLVEERRPDPRPGPGEIRLRVRACGVCRTDLHVIDGDLPPRRRPIIPGHEVVGVVDAVGPQVTGVRIGDRVGAPWLAQTCGRCRYCREGEENLCDDPVFNGWTRDGGYADMMIARADFCLPIPSSLTDVEAAPLLCAGLIGFRAWRKACAGRPVHALGLYGFGAAAHLLAQLAIFEGQSVHAFTRDGDTPAQALAMSLGCVWAGGSGETPPGLLDAAIIFAPIGDLAPLALRAGVGVIEAVGAAVTTFRPGDNVLISCISSCGKCDYCRKGMYSHCVTGGWILGHRIDGTQAEYVRIPHAETSLYPIPAGADEEAMVMLSDILPTGFECGVLNGKVAPGSTVAIVGAGPIGLAALLTAQLYSPAEIIMIDLDDNRLDVARRFGATHAINSGAVNAVERVSALTGGRGVDAAIEAVGVPATFQLCEDLVAPGGVIANIGVHGRAVELHLETLWSRNIAITTRLVDTATTPMLLKTVQSGKIDPSRLITHRFTLDQILDAYDTFGRAAETRALKVIINAGPTSSAG